MIDDQKRTIRLATAIKITGPADAPDVDATSVPTIRALATELNRHRDWTVAVGVRPAGADPSAAQMDALARSFAIVRVLASYSHRDGVAESVSWDAVKQKPQAETGIAFLVLTSGAPAAPAQPAPKAPAPAPAPAGPTVPAPPPPAPTHP